MPPLLDLARQHGIHVVEDACQALFSRNSAGCLGTQSQAGCYSLGVTKLVSSGFGGIVVTTDRALDERMRLLRNQGLEDTLMCEYQEPGFNFKCSDILAALALVQLAKRDDKIRHVKAIYARYQEAIQALPFLSILPVDVQAGELPLYVQVMCPLRAELMPFLMSEGIQTRKMPPDLAAATYLSDSTARPATRFASEGLVLPCGPDQPLGNVERVINSLRRFGELRRERPIRGLPHPEPATSRPV